jgi:hypothetical protein
MTLNGTDRSCPSGKLIPELTELSELGASLFETTDHDDIESDADHRDRHHEQRNSDDGDHGVAAIGVLTGLRILARHAG